MIGSAVLHSSVSVEWSTPYSLFRQLDAEFQFKLDAAATAENAKCVAFFTAKEDGLARSWQPGPIFLNPPYGRALGLWISKAYEESRLGATVVCVVPARTDTRWFHTYVLPHAEVRFLQGRVKFGGAKYNAPFPTMVVVFRGKKEKLR